MRGGAGPASESGLLVRGRVSEEGEERGGVRDLGTKSAQYSGHLVAYQAVVEDVQWWRGRSARLDLLREPPW